MTPMEKSTNPDFFYAPGMADMEQRFIDRMDRGLLFGKHEVFEKRRIANLDNRKWAFIFQGRTKMMAMVDTVTMIAYRVDWSSRRVTWMPIKGALFIEWATMWHL